MLHVLSDYYYQKISLLKIIAVFLQLKINSTILLLCNYYSLHVSSIILKIALLFIVLLVRSVDYHDVIKNGSAGMALKVRNWKWVRLACLQDVLMDEVVQSTKGYFDLSVAQTARSLWCLHVHGFLHVGGGDLQRSCIKVKRKHLHAGSRSAR